MTSKPRKQIHLAAHFPGVNNTTVWSAPGSGSHIEFDSFVQFARIAERAKFDFLFLDQLHRANAKTNTQDAIIRTRGAATLQVAENRQPGLLAGESF